MAIAMDSADAAALWNEFAAHTRVWIERSGAYAARLHADEVGPEHVLCTLMDDENCAAYRAVVHAFADPATIADETRAMAAGITVSGSAASLPFSELGVRALREARSLAAHRGDAAVELAHLLEAAFAQFDADIRASFEAAGWNSAIETSPTRGPKSIAESGPLFRSFSDEAKRAMSAAARLARQGELRSIGPAQLLLACLQADPRVERSSGISTARARLLLRGHSEDTTEVSGPALPPDEALVGFLRGMRRDADSLALLAHFHAGRTPELAQVLMRHKVTVALLARAAGAFSDSD
jgi:ATP-dependent Clp protease ATP-binding subunit ClpA